MTSRYVSRQTDPVRELMTHYGNHIAELIAGDH
jgi:hypothetical protein